MQQATALAQPCPIPGLTGYGATEDGGIWSRRPRNGIGPLRDTWRPIRPTFHRSTGYMKIRLRVDGRVKDFLVHHLIARVFLGPRPPGKLVLHDDGNVRNNAVSNLKYGTNAENMQDAIRHGTLARGSRSGSAKLNEDDVRFARDAHRKGDATVPQLATLFDVSYSTIRLAINRDTWRHVAKLVASAPEPDGRRPLTLEQRAIRRAARDVIGYVYALHEAAHCVVAELLGITVRRCQVSLTEDGWFGIVFFHRYEETTIPTDIAISLAGTALERSCGFATYTAENKRDRDQAGAVLGWVFEHGECAVDMVEEHLSVVFAMPGILKAVQTVADELKAKGELDGFTVRSVITDTLGDDTQAACNFVQQVSIRAVLGLYTPND